MSTQQLVLTYDPKPEPLLPLYTPKQIADSQKEQTLRVLRLLQAGPRTTGMFLAAGIGRFSARIAELKAVGWLIERERLSDHSWCYTLKGRR